VRRQVAAHAVGQVVVRRIRHAVSNGARRPVPGDRDGEPPL
jgi:hypothetical protein